MINILEQFFNRDEELRYMEEEYSRPGFKFLVIYGRRRVGKTFLIKKFLETKENAIYFYISEMSPQSLREDLARELYYKLGLRLEFRPSWEKIFRSIFRLASEEPVILVFDEFQRLLEIDRAALSTLQRIIDEESSSTHLMLICSGSSIGVMERTFEYRQPLYGRATGFLKIKPFSFYTAYRFLANRVGVGPVEAAEIYGVFGGTPYYLSMVSSSNWIEEASRLILDYRSPLYLEPELLLKTELREYVTYFEILRRLAEGKSSFSELAGSIGVSRTSLSYYLNVLIKDLDIVAREEPIGGRRAIYKITDNFFRFWFRYVFPNRTLLEFGEKEPVVERTRKDFNTYMGLVFQDIVKQEIWRLKLPFKPYIVGGWWSKNTEVDVVAVDSEKRRAVLLEVKWRKLGGGEARRILRELEEKSREIYFPVKYYGLVAIDIVGREDLEEEGYLVYDIRQITT